MSWTNVAAAGTSGILGFGTAYHNRKFAEKQSDLAYQRDLEHYRRQNRYNSPKQQMARLKKAGLNPNLVYGDGALTMQSKGDVNYQPVNAPMPTGLANDIIGTATDLKLRQEQIKNIAADTQSKKNYNYQAGWRNAILSNESDIKARQNTMGAELYDTQIQIQKSIEQKNWKEVERIQAQTDFINAGMTKLEVETEKIASEALYMKYRNAFRKLGITDSDHALIRVAYRLYMNNEDMFLEWLGIPNNSNLKDYIE